MSVPTVSVVVPTIAGREDLLDRTVEGFRATAHGEAELIVVRGRPNIGSAWNDGAGRASGAYLMLAADDVVMSPGWLDAAINAAEDGVWPSPRILNRDGSLHSCGTMGAGLLLGDAPDGAVCGTSPFPFIVRSDWERVGPCLPVHYYGDDYLAWRARSVGFEVRVCRGYELTHLEGTVGRRPMIARAQADCRAYLDAVAHERVPVTA